MNTADRSAGMRLARWSAVVIIIAVGAAAFRLSFATLKDLAVLAHIPASDAWLFPLIVDGTILLATFGVLVLANAPERRFFVTVLVIGSIVSVAGNSLHAVAAGRELPWWASALVAAIAPISLLADTHGLALLIRAAQRDSAPEPAPAAVVEPAVEQATPEPDPEPVSVPEPEPETKPEPVPLPVPEPVRVAELRPVPDAPVHIPVRSSRPQQTMLPIAVPVGG
ncbi:DUF2637 domain-containing protein [Nocardia sp. CDC186]|uniref:DUF2637 domain-containing protein n=1 Tax=Nocardia implantans TaxID=3108168 RepID=A0ABU6B1C0_9NOCA|nr:MULTISPECIES: DUF2637 domain-containing protein [unclassified Nocardia]MEA3531250.1 DUF2637 domain-containing protein [Nocardia sp. CDC192]MEB3513540.1 DUF2637 domain-containing protein [Nocardia sp. CDC186]